MEDTKLMVDIISKIERIKYKVFQKELEKKKIDDLEKLLQSPHITYEDVILIQDLRIRYNASTQRNAMLVGLTSIVSMT